MTYGCQECGGDCKSRNRLHSSSPDKCADGKLARYSFRVKRVVGLPLKHRAASIFTPHENVEAGGLISYGQNLAENYIRAATYVDKILKGANPAELPVEQTSEFEMVINRRTAKELGLRIPADLLLRADRLID